MIQYTDVVEKIAESVHQPKGFVKGILDAFLDLLDREEAVAIRGFGKFRHHTTVEQMGRNPKTGAPAIIPARRVLKFKASKTH